MGSLASGFPVFGGSMKKEVKTEAVKEEVVEEVANVNDMPYTEVFLFKDNDRYKDPCENVIINGKKYSIPRGKKVKVPYVVAQVLQQSQLQTDKARQMDEAAQREQVINM